MGCGGSGGGGGGGDDGGGLWVEADLNISCHGGEFELSFGSVYGTTSILIRQKTKFQVEIGRSIFFFRLWKYQINLNGSCAKQRDILTGCFTSKHT